MKSLVMLGITMIHLLAVTPARADCGEIGKRAVVGSPPDIFFVAGTPSTQLIPDVLFTYPTAGLPPPYDTQADCGMAAESTITGVTLRENYCTWSGVGMNCRTGEQVVAINGSETGALVYQYYYPNFVRQIEVTYNGAAPAGTTGRVDLRLYEDGAIGPVIASVNVRIVSGTAPSTWFTITSTATTTIGDSIVIDHPLTNGNPGARPFVTHVWNNTRWNHPLAVWYDGAIFKWKIRNEDGAAMQTGLSFHVHPDPSVKRIQTAQFGQGTYLVIDDQASNANPYATIIVTPNTNGTKRFVQPFTVAYNAPYWQIMTANNTNMPASDKFGNNVGFFVKIVGASQYIDDSLSSDPSGVSNTENSNGAGIDIWAANSRLSGNLKYLTKFCWTTNSVSPLGTPIIITPNLTPLPPPAPINYSSVNPGYFGVWRSGTILTGYSSTVYNEAANPGAATPAMPNLSAFNIWGPYKADCPPVYP